MIGSRLGSYEITAKVGEGGMGEVYRATDTRLGREVALKVLPAAFVADAERLARFEREARVLASLNHPNVAAIHEVGEEGGTHFLVMELAPGETLAERMARGPVPVREAIPIALQVATALEAAHERGIVHRDLKPANVKVDGDGRVKVLDFGLAKALDPEPGSAPAPGLTHSPTLTLQATQAGVLLGTAAYMSPEQAKGQPADKRADIWAFGVVLWEMLSGRRLFQESSISETLAAVLKSDPDPRELPAVPLALRTLLDRCLRKDPRERLHDAADVRIALEDALAAPDGATEARPPATRSPWSRAARAFAAVLLLAGAVALGWVLGSRRDDGAPRSIRFAIHPPRGVGFVQDPAVADDGSFLVYKGWTDDGSRLFLHHVDRFASQPLAGTEGADLPFLSPDGRWVGFVRDGDLLRVPTAGGEALLIAENAAQGPGATWGPRGSIVYSTAWLGGLA
ncbi:MAG TPA: protein kinase, partial [Thermoanaerobaculia bacterium]|nr:protein kinase [Thermoanaerobaculia bacterium]